MDGWQHLLRRQRSLQSEARSEHHRRARPSSPLASRPSPMSVAASFSPRSLPPAPTPMLPRQQQRTQTGAVGALPFPPRPVLAMDPGEVGGPETETDPRL